MAALAAGGSPVVRRLLLHSCDGRRHERRRKWDRRQQASPPQQEEQGRVSITVEDVGRGAKDALRNMARTSNEWRANLVGVTTSSAAAGVTAADCMAAGTLCLLLAVATKAGIALSMRYLIKTQRKAVTRRDRSLGGREVVVGTQNARQQPKVKPLIPLDDHLASSSTRQQRRNREQVPAWWMSPTSSPSAPDLYARAEADALVGAIVNKRLGGIDFEEEDAVQICRHSGAKAEFSTENTRDSFFRAAVGYVLSACSSRREVPAGGEVEYSGEGMASFLCGLAANINLEPARAASMVNAAVAARTRAGFLQAWASVAQGKVNEALSDIRGLVCMHGVFPPEPNSPHMEMVGRGLENHLALHERLELLRMYTELAPQGAQVAVDALSLAS